MKGILKQMPAFAKVSSKEQVTIPNIIRQAMGIKTGSELVFIPDKNELNIKIFPPATPLEQLEGSLKPKVEFKIEDLDRFIAEEIVNNFKKKMS